MYTRRSNLLIRTNIMEAHPITQEKYNKLVNENISLTDENDHLKEQAHTLSTTLIAYMNIVLKMVQIMNQNGLAVDVNEIIRLYL